MWYAVDHFVFHVHRFGGGFRCEGFTTYNPNPFNDYKDPLPKKSLMPLDIILDFAK
jgi:hypothetical protein